VALCAAGLVWGCAPHRVRAPEQPGSDTIVLLPDPDTGTTGRAIVSNTAGAVDLVAARESTRVSANQPPAAPTVMSEADVKAVFADVFSALPPPPRHFTLYFRFESDELTEESRALVPKIRQTVRDRPTADVVIVGHTDTTGAPASNFTLAYGRAIRVRDLLVEAGLLTYVEVTSHGEAELLVQTADDVLEPRNRRVEITIR
jgi:outer membrane protein OmpA-like peptidoglycan-associated protein